MLLHHYDVSVTSGFTMEFKALIYSKSGGIGDLRGVSLHHYGVITSLRCHYIIMMSLLLVAYLKRSSLLTSVILDNALVVVPSWGVEPGNETWVECGSGCWG